MQLKDVSVLITGGGSGLGAATARAMAAKGAKVAVLDLNMDNAERVAKDIGGIAVQCNVSDPDSMQQAIDTAEVNGGATVLRTLREPRRTREPVPVGARTR